MGNFAYNSDSKRFLDAYKVYFSLLPSSTCDPIDLAPMLYTLSIFKLMNVKKQLKFVDEFEAVQDVGHLMENNHNPVHRFTSSLMGHSIGRHNLFPDKKLQFKPEFVEKLLEAAWYGSYYQHTLHFIKRMENLRYNKVFARPFNIYQLKALGLHGDLVDIKEAVSLQSVFPRVLRVLDEVDACDLQRSLNFKLPSITRFDSVYFTFPYANTNNNEETPSLKPFDSHFVGIGRHSQLIQAFLRSTKDVITPNGEVVMICFLSQLVVWEAEHIVEQEGWTLDKAYEFNYKVWKELGYVPKRTHGLDAFVSMSNGRGDGGEDVAYVVHFSRK
eukprot:gene30510-36873_t